MACFNTTDHHCRMLLDNRFRVLRWSNGVRCDSDIIRRADLTGELCKSLVRKCGSFDLTFRVLEASRDVTLPREELLTLQSCKGFSVGECAQPRSNVDHRNAPQRTRIHQWQ